VVLPSCGCHTCDDNIYSVADCGRSDRDKGTGRYGGIKARGRGIKVRRNQGEGQRRRDQWRLKGEK
jgi:hypothetical protein